jgi:predicted transglutaminase-like cysteine proteinase
MIELAIEAGCGQMKPLISLTLITLAGLMLAGCEDIPASDALTDGVATAAPAGWLNYCTRHVEDSGCRR